MSGGMEIAFFGSSLVSAYWNGAATYYRGMLRSLAERGHRITFYEPDAFGRQQHRDIPDPSWACVVVYPVDGQDGVRRCLSDAGTADVIVKASGVGVFDELLQESVLELKAANNQVLYWDVDAPATLDRVGKLPTDPFRPLIARYDLILTYGGGPPVVRAYRALGARAVAPIYNALDPTTHHPTSADARFASDLAFLGNRLPDREQRVEDFFLSPARALPNKSFVLGGSGWGTKALTQNVNYVGHVYTADHNAFNSTPRAVLNISRESMASFGYSPATRVFEAAGASACIITDAWVGIDTFLEPGREILVADSGAQVQDLVLSLTEAQAKRIGAAARKRVLAEHTYERRAALVEGLLTGRLEAAELCA